MVVLRINQANPTKPAGPYVQLTECIFSIFREGSSVSGTATLQVSVDEMGKTVCRMFRVVTACVIIPILREKTKEN